jgi:hypothetical protein
VIALLNWRLWAAIGLAAVLAFTHLTAYRKGRDVVRTEWLASVAAANEDARKLENARQSRADEAARTAAAAQGRILADAASARRESDGLRGNLDAAVQYAAKSRAAAERTAGLATDLLGRCTSLYLGVAEAAARADSEARELRSAWPK